MPQKIIKDSVHGYIALDEMFIDIVDSAEFQRLKSIEQGSFRVLYPAARHDRFIHSLGTYYLATKFSENLVVNIKTDLDISIPKDELEKIQYTFYYAALLHDIGHAPFSHTTEKFFKQKELCEGGYKYRNIAIYENLIKSISNIVDEIKLDRFIIEFEESSPSPHEIMSATILINKADEFLGENKEKIYLDLAARMVIGCTYDYNNLLEESEEEKNIRGIKNCFIRLLNSSTVDVDKMDYITRDTQMSGFDNVSIDIERLTRSVTAIKDEDGWIYPAFRKNALSVIDNVFRAKTEQSLWMVSHPVVMYDSELLAYCINSLHKHIGSDYIIKVFSIEALSKSGIEYNNKVYKLLNDIDIHSDLRVYYGNNLIDELYERSMRRHPIWKSYYEYKYLFNDKLNGEEKVFIYFKGLIDYMKLSDKFILNKEIYDQLSGDSNISEQVKEAAGFLNGFCEESHIDYNFTILQSSNTFAANFKADEVYIQFGNLPSRDKCNYATYEFLKGQMASSDSKRFFYLYSKEKFNSEIMGKFKDKLINRINEIEVKIQQSKAKKKPRA
jgi:HD superfamily phosphohydrolase